MKAQYISLCGVSSRHLNLKRYPQYLNMKWYPRNGLFDPITSDILFVSLCWTCTNHSLIKEKHYVRRYHKNREKNFNVINKGLRCSIKFCSRFMHLFPCGRGPKRSKQVQMVQVTGSSFKKQENRMLI